MKNTAFKIGKKEIDMNRLYLRLILFLISIISTFLIVMVYHLYLMQHKNFYPLKLDIESIIIITIGIFSITTTMPLLIKSPSDLFLILYLLIVVWPYSIFQSNILFDDGPFGRIVDSIPPLVILINPFILSATQILF